MKVIGLVSGGKDSCFSMCKVVEQGHHVVCLGQLCPPPGLDELDSHMYQTVGHDGVPWIAKAMNLPLVRRLITRRCVVNTLNYQPKEDDEVEDMYALLKDAKRLYGVEGVSVGAICSSYQKARVANVCERLNLEMLALLWRREQVDLLDEMIRQGVNAIVIKTASLGLDPSAHLGKTLNQLYDHFLVINAKYGFHVCGEGGEYETFVTDCSLFNSVIKIGNLKMCLTNDDPICPVGYLKFDKFTLEKK